jgi:signal transduction histidine kinase
MRAAMRRVGAAFRRSVSSLTNRIFVALTLLTTLSLGFAFYFANARASSEAEVELTRGLREAATLVEQHRATLTGTFTVMARLIADLPVLKAAMETGDAPTVQPLADDFRGKVSADLLVLHDTRGQRLAASGAELPASWKPRLDADEESRFLAHPLGVLEVVSVPIVLGLESPDVLGRLTVGFLMDDELASQFRNLTGSEIAFAADQRILAASLPPGSRAPMAAALAVAGTTTIRLGAEDYLALALPMERTSGGSSPVTLTLRSRTERLRSLNTLRAGLIGVLIVTLLLATILSYGLATTMTRPLAAVTHAMRDVAATGDLTRRVPVQSRAWDDADARLLASAFNTLTESIARFQRESAQKERLSALGRLSTVIAHEIRNPLMIIWASLSMMRKSGVSADELGEAIADIDSESRRINRIITEVLDFAKPIRFDLSEADLNDVCRDSAAATWVDVPDPSRSASSPVLVLDEALPTVVTDAERLRTALVNLLTNARHAVEKAALPDPTPVTLRTHGTGERVIITVSDRGTGITPEDMAHIFEPYFTTKRTGTGIGLAITRNIIEGLGGTLSVNSRLGEGTEFRIDLPRTAAEAA